MGDAAYVYTKTADGCTISIDSRRAVQAGADVEISECDVKIKTGALDSPVQRDLALFNLITSLLPVVNKEPIRESDTVRSDQ